MVDDSPEPPGEDGQRDQELLAHPLQEGQVHQERRACTCTLPPSPTARGSTAEAEAEAAAATRGPAAAGGSDG